MKTALLFMLLAPAAFAQSLSSFTGDYTLKTALNACNQNARVSIALTGAISIINPDPRDNRGWATVKLKPGKSVYSPIAGYESTTTVTIQKTVILVDTVVTRTGQSDTFVRDIYSFKNENGRKSLAIELSAITRGNVSGYGTTCIYEKK